MSEIFFMNGHGLYVWFSYAITLAVIVLNVWQARRSHARNLRQARDLGNRPRPSAGRATVRQVE